MRGSTSIPSSLLRLVRPPVLILLSSCLLGGTLSFDGFSPRLPLFSPLASLSEPRSATLFFTQQTAGNTVCGTRLRWICFSSFSLENRVLFHNRPRSISLLSSSSSCLVVESLPLSDAISLRIKGLQERRGNTLCRLILIQETA